MGKEKLKEKKMYIPCLNSVCSLQCLLKAFDPATVVLQTSQV